MARHSRTVADRQRSLEAFSFLPTFRPAVRAWAPDHPAPLDGTGGGDLPSAVEAVAPVPGVRVLQVLVEGHIPYPVEAVLDAPVPTGKAQQSPGIGISGWETANCIAHSHLFLALHDPLAL